MGLFSRLLAKRQERKQKQREEMQQENLLGAPFMMHFLMEEECSMPDKETALAAMKKKFGEIDCVSDDKNMAMFAIHKYQNELKDGDIPATLILMGASSTNELAIDEITRGQMWTCPESKEILENCKYQVIAHDLITEGLDYKQKADLLMDYMEAVLELFPSCKGVYFENSGKMFSRDAILEHTVEKEERFVYFAVNIRVFNIQGSDELLVDSLGMNVVRLPDIQYHFNEMDPNWVVQHAYNMLCDIYEKDCSIETGHTISGILDGEMNEEVKWRCAFEESLIAPERPVIDIHMGEYAAGKRPLVS